MIVARASRSRSLLLVSVQKCSGSVLQVRRRPWGPCRRGDNLRLNSLRGAIACGAAETVRKFLAYGRAGRARGPCLRKFIVWLSCLFWARFFWARVFHVLRAPRAARDTGDNEPDRRSSFSFFHKPRTCRRCLGKYTHTGFKLCLPRRRQGPASAQRAARAIVNTLPLEVAVNKSDNGRWFRRRWVTTAVGFGARTASPAVRNPQKPGRDVLYRRDWGVVRVTSITKH